MLLKELLKNSKKFHEAKNGSNYYIDTETYDIYKVSKTKKGDNKNFTIGEEAFKLHDIELGKFYSARGRDYYRTENIIYEVMKRKVVDDVLTITEGGESFQLTIKEILEDLGISDYVPKEVSVQKSKNFKPTLDFLLQDCEEVTFKYKNNTYKISKLS